MNITSAQYMNNTSTNERDAIKTIIDGQTWVVPLDPANTHYAEILRQVDAGELTIADAD
jgi:hypothetical protein